MGSSDGGRLLLRELRLLEVDFRLLEADRRTPGLMRDEEDDAERDSLLGSDADDAEERQQDESLCSAIGDSCDTSEPRSCGWTALRAPT